MKNVVIGVLGGIAAAQSTIWVSADNADRLLITLAFAVIITAIITAVEDTLRERRLNAWRTKRMLGKMDFAAKQNRP